MKAFAIAVSIFAVFIFSSFGTVSSQSSQEATCYIFDRPNPGQVIKVVCNGPDNYVDDFGLSIPNFVDVAKTQGVTISNTNCYILRNGHPGMIEDKQGAGYCEIARKQFEGQTVDQTNNATLTPEQQQEVEQAKKEDAANNVDSAGNSLPNAERNAVINCDGSEEKGPAAAADCLKINPIVIMIKNVINAFSLLFGVIVIIVIVWAGFTYARAGGDPNTTAEAKRRIRNAIIAIPLYVFLYALLMWLVPGGPF